MVFGQRFRQLRKDRRMTQREVAERAGIDFTYLSKIETGVMPPPSAKTIIALARALDLDSTLLDELFGLAKKLPSDLVTKVSPEAIRMLRSIQEETDDAR